MVTIDSLDNSASTGVFKLNQNEQDEQRKAIDERLKDGDTVKISAEAMELFKSKMEEYGAENPGDLTKEQHEDLKDTMESFAEENGINPENMPRPGGRPSGMPPEACLLMEKAAHPEAKKAVSLQLAVPEATSKLEPLVAQQPHPQAKALM